MNDDELLQLINIELTETQLEQIGYILQNYMPGDNLRLQFTRKGPTWQLVRPSGPLPDKCLHRVAHNFTEEGRHWILCVSCDSTLDDEFVME